MHSKRLNIFAKIHMHVSNMIASIDVANCIVLIFKSFAGHVRNVPTVSCIR